MIRDISAILRHMRTFAEREMKTTGIGFPEQMILMHLTENDGTNQEQIARYFDIDRAAIAKTAAKLERKGYISRKTNERNKREKLLTLTPEAQEVVTLMARTFDRWEQAAYSGVDDDVRQSFEATLAQVAANAADVLKGDTRS